MLINDKNYILYETLSNEEKDFLRESCKRFIRNEDPPGVLSCDFFNCDFVDLFTCKMRSKEIPRALLKLMDCVSDESLKNQVTDESLKNQVTDESSKNQVTGESLKDDFDETLIKAISNDIDIPFDQYDNKILHSTFIEYLRRYFGDFLDTDLMIILVLLYKNDYKSVNRGREKILKRNEFIQRIPFMMTKEYRDFFIKLRSIGNIKEMSEYIIKRGEESVREQILRDIIQAEYNEVPEEFFTD